MGPTRDALIESRIEEGEAGNNTIPRPAIDKKGWWMSTEAAAEEEEEAKKRGGLTSALKTWLWQFKILLHRNFANYVRNPGNVLARLVILTSVALLHVSSYRLYLHLCHRPVY
jgi:hypothetical protein